MGSVAQKTASGASCGLVHADAVFFTQLVTAVCMTMGLCMQRVTRARVALAAAAPRLGAIGELLGFPRAVYNPDEKVQTDFLLEYILDFLISPETSYFDIVL